jgi:hypothetical protein
MARFKTMVERGSTARIRAAADFVLSMCAGPDSGFRAALALPGVAARFATDLQRFFRVTPPVVHQMLKTLEAHGFIDREPGIARSIKLRLARAQLPDLE